jgi:hypothetical protein
LNAFLKRRVVRLYVAERWGINIRILKSNKKIIITSKNGIFKYQIKNSLQKGVIIMKTHKSLLLRTIKAELESLPRLTI